MVKDLCFEIIEKCPNNCKFCSSNSNSLKTRLIKFDDFKRVIDYFMDNGGISELSLSGGEPFLHPDLFSMIKYAKTYGIKTVIFTSGVVKNEKLNIEQKNFLQKEMNERIDEVKKYEPWNTRLISNIKKYYMNYIDPNEYTNISKATFKYLENIGLDKIVFDYQGYERKTDNDLMGRDEASREAMLNSLLYAGLSNLDVDVHFIPMKKNYKEIIDILEMLEIAGIKNISILNFVPQGRGRKNVEELKLSHYELNDFFEIISNYKKYYSGRIRIGIPLQKENSHKCTAGLEKIDIKFDGTVLPCPAFKELTEEEAIKYNIKLYNIYDSIDKVVVPGYGTRIEPLCKKLYKVNK